jgi:flagellar protein FliO/FliZ
MKNILTVYLLSMLSFFAHIAEGSAHSQAVNPSANLLQMIIGLIAVIFMIFALVWLIKKTGYASYQANNTMKIKSCLALSAKERLMLIEVGDEQLLIGVAPGFVGHVKTLDTPLSSNTDTNKTFTFVEKLKLALKGETVE